MNRAVASSRGLSASSFVVKAGKAWADPLPDWVYELAKVADIEGLRLAGERIDYSTGAVSAIIAGKYKGDLGRVEEMVRGALMAATVECPVIGEIGRDRCLTEQDEPFRATSAFRARLFHACRTCRNRRQK